MISYENGDTASAITDLETVVKSYRGTTYACMSGFLLGNIYYNKRDYIQAQAYYEENLKKYKSYELFSGASLRGLGNCAIQSKQYDKAIEYFDEFIKGYSKHYLFPEVLLSLGECYLKTGKKEEASITFKKLISGAYAQTPQAENAKRMIAAL
jgi:TolA-binding protein